LNDFDNHINPRNLHRVSAFAIGSLMLVPVLELRQANAAETAAVNVTQKADESIRPFHIHVD
jgi:hypothetical protein